MLRIRASALSTLAKILLHILYFSWYFELSGPEVIMVFFMLNSAEHEISTVLKSKMLKKGMSCFQSLKYFFMLTHVKMPIIVVTCMLYL